MTPTTHRSALIRTSRQGPFSIAHRAIGAPRRFITSSPAGTAMRRRPSLVFAIAC
jgi:hypothetical protein